MVLPLNLERPFKVSWRGNNNIVFISYIKYTNITPPANSKANRDRGSWCVDGPRFITNSWSEKKDHIKNKKEIK